MLESNARRNLGASPEFKERKASSNGKTTPGNGRSFLSGQPSFTQDLHLRVDDTQKSSTPSSQERACLAKRVAHTVKEQSLSTKSTQDLDLKLDTQKVENLSTSQLTCRNTSTPCVTQDISLRIDTQLETSGASEDLHLKLESSIEDQASPASDPSEEKRCRQRATSTLQAQRSFISQIHWSLTKVNKDLKSENTKASGVELSSAKNTSPSRSALKENNHERNQNNVTSDDVWLSASSRKSVSGGISKGRKRKNESLSANEKSTNETNGGSLKRRR